MEIIFRSPEITILNARDAFLDSRVGLSEKTITNYENSTSLLLKPDPNKLLHRFTVRNLEDTLSKFSNLNTRRTHRRVFGVFFSWAVRHHYCLENPCDRLDKIPPPSSESITLEWRLKRRSSFSGSTKMSV